MNYWKLGICATLLAAAAPAAAADYSNLFVFGDSLVDSGNAHIGAPTIYHLPDPAPASEGYYKGRFSNGYNYADYLSSRMGFGPATSYLEGGNNYAVGGATAAPNADIPSQASGSIVPSIETQVTDYYEKAVKAGTRPAIDPNSLVLVNIGANDARALLQYGEGTPTPSETLHALGTSLNDLIADGARNILLVNVADIGEIPSVVAAGSQAQAAGTGLAQNLNTAFDGIVTGLTPTLTSLGGSISLFDLYGLQEDLIADPSRFGLDKSLLTHSCVGDSAQASGCAGYAFFDGIHPTAAVDKIVADHIATQLDIAAVPEPASWAMMIGGVAIVGGAMRRRKTGEALASA